MLLAQRLTTAEAYVRDLELEVAKQVPRAHNAQCYCYTSVVFASPLVTAASFSLLWLAFR